MAYLLRDEPFSGVMKKDHKGPSTYPKLIIIILLFSLLVSADYHYFSTRLKKSDLYDELNNHFAAIRTLILKLEYTLDMFIVARRFEDTTVSLIKRDVERLGSTIDLAVNNPRYARLADDNDLLQDGFASIAEDWTTITLEVESLNEDMPQEEVMLIHNEVDVNTILVNETAERLIGVVTAAKKSLMAELYLLVLINIAGFLLLWLAAFTIIYRSLIRPVKNASDVAARIASGDFSTRFDEREGGLARPLKRSLNVMLDAIAIEGIKREERLKEEEDRLNAAVGQIKAMGLLTAFAGTSLSRADIFSSNLKEVMDHAYADAAAIHVMEGGSLILKSSEGFAGTVLDNVAVISEEAFKAVAGSGEAQVFSDLKLFPEQGYAEILRSSGYNALVIAPVEYGEETRGTVSALYSDPGTILPSTPAFLEAVATNIEVFSGYINLFHNEYTFKKFLERILNQLPIGVAVFDRSGTCTLVNSNLKNLLGTGPDNDMVGEYRILEDEVFKGQGMISSINKAYEGYRTEFIINYDPVLVKRFNFNGSQKRLKIKSVPIYDEGGEISNIVLLYEEMTDTAGHGNRAEEAG